MDLVEKISRRRSLVSFTVRRNLKESIASRNLERCKNASESTLISMEMVSRTP